MSIHKIARISVFTALICVFTIVIPPIYLAGIPITLQTLMVMIIAVLLKPDEAFISLILYLVLGVIGLPVFSGFKSGLSTLLGPTGGFLLSFPLAVLFISILKGKQSFIRILILNIVFGIIFVYLCGALSLALVTDTSYSKAMGMILIFIPFDILKAIIATYIGLKLTYVSFIYK